MSSTTEWRIIEASLRARGLWNEDGISRRARARLCPRCRGPIMVGLDDDVAAAAAKCDPTPLNPLGEATALLTDRRTYSLRWIGGRYLLDQRDAWRIKGKPAGTDPREEVLAEHKCGLETPDNLRGPYMQDPRPHKTTDTDEAPF